MKKILTLALLSALLSCTPYQRLFLNRKSINTFFNDSCDIHMISQVHKMLDSTAYRTMQNPTMLLDKIEMDSCCAYYLKEMYHQRLKDSTIWLLTIRPFQVGKDEIILGNLYTLFPKQDSLIILERRVKEYSQTKEFESGKYIILTYRIENDTTAIANIGKRKY